MSAQTHTIVDTAVANGSFTSLVSAVKAAGLAETLNGTGPFTVFAPNDAAFAKLPKGALDDLIKPENKTKLAGILKMHVVAGKVMASDIAGKTSNPKSFQGETLTIDGMNGVNVNGSKVVSSDVACSNGVIHVIDTVMMPKA